MAQVGDGPVINPDGDGNNNQNQNPNPNQNQIKSQTKIDLLLIHAPIVPGAPPRLQLNWYHFKPKYAGKPDKDVEAHLLRTNDWMDMHEFPDQVKVQRFCLTFIGEAMLWYESLGPINADCVSLKKLFKQQYSNIGNTREQLFLAWRSFHFNDYAKTIDTSVTW